MARESRRHRHVGKGGQWVWPVILGGGMVVAIAILVFGLRAWGTKATEHPPRTTPIGANVLLISIDTLRPDHLSCYRYMRKTSPRIDALAAEGALFENHISSTSWTLPAHAALFTSLADSVHGCTDTDKRLSEDVVTLAERFATAGYETVGFFSGPYLHPAFGLGQGFEHYENCSSTAEETAPGEVEAWADNVGVMQHSHRDVTSPRLYEAFARWLSGRQDKPFFLFVHMWDPHFDFIPPPPYDTLFDPAYAGPVDGRNFFFDPAINANMPARDKEHLKALYDGEIAWTDLHIGKIVDDLKVAGLLDKTVVAVTSDHGTEFFEHGYKGHRMTLFDEVIRIPLVIRYPQAVPAGVRVGLQTRSVDVGPTLMALVGLEHPEDVMGFSLLSLMHRGAAEFENAAVSELFSVGRRMRALRTLEWKFIDDVQNRARAYFDLMQDPAEQQPIFDVARGAGRLVLEKYGRVIESLEAWQQLIAAGSEQSEIPEEVLRQLRSLGYVGEEKRRGDGTTEQRR